MRCQLQKGLVLLSLITVILMGCTKVEPEFFSALPTPPPSATMVIHTYVLPSPLPSFSLQKSPTPTTSLFPSPSPTTSACAPLWYPKIPASLRLEDLQWRELPVAGHRVRHLGGSPYPIVPLEKLDEGEERLLVGWFKTPEKPFIFPFAFATASIDLANEAHRWLWQNPNTPTPTPSPTLTPPVNILFIKEQETLWRIDLHSGRREAVLDSEMPGEEGGGLVFWYARDWSYVVVVEYRYPQVRVWRVDAQIGVPPRHLATFAGPIFGQGWVNADTGQLVGSPYWVIALPNEQFGEGFIVNVEQGGVIPPTELGLPERTHFEAIRLSPDGRWVAFQLRVKEEKADPEVVNRWLYVAPGENVQQGIWLKGMTLIIERWQMVGWGVDPPLLVVEDQQKQVLRLVPLPPPADAPQGYQLEGAIPPVVSIAGGIITGGKSGRVIVWNARGKRTAEVTLAPYYVEIYALLPDVEENEEIRRVWIAGRLGELTRAGRCTAGWYGLVEWTLP